MTLVRLPFPICWGPVTGLLPTNAMTSGGSIGSTATVTFDAAGKKIDLIIGYSPGGTYDLYARLVARHLVRFIPGQPGIVVPTSYVTALS